MVQDLFMRLATLADQTPVLVAIDDVESADPSSLHFLSYLVRRLGDARVLVLGMSRSNETASASGGQIDFLSRASTVKLRLKPLNQRDVAALVRSEFGRDANEHFCNACHKASDGNPLLLRELVSELRASGFQPTAANADRLLQLRPGLEVRIKMGRLAQAGPSAGKLARALAVLGDAAQVGWAAELVGLGIGPVSATVDALVAAEILTDDFPPRFNGENLRRAVYDSLPPAQLALMHAEAAQLLARKGADPAVVGAHLIQTEPAGDPAVVQTLRQAAAEAVARSAPRQAVTYLTRAIHEPPPAEQRTAVLAELAVAADAAQEPSAAEWLASALARSDDVRTRATLALLLARQFVHQERLREAAVTLERAQQELGDLDPDLLRRIEAERVLVGHLDRKSHAAFGPDLDDLDRTTEPDGPDQQTLLSAACGRAAFRAEPVSHTAAMARTVLARWRDVVNEMPSSVVIMPPLMALMWADQLERTERLCAEIAPRSAESVHPAAVVLTLTLRSECAYRQGALAAAEAFARTALASARARAMDMEARYATAFLVQVLVERGELDQASEVLDELSAEGELPPQLSSVSVQHARGLVHLARCEYPKALAAFEGCGEKLLAWGCVNPAAMPWRSNAAVALAALGEHERALELATEELALARQFGAPRAIGMALRACAVVKNTEDSSALLAESVATLEGSSARLELARSLVDYGSQLRRAKRQNEARTTLYRGMDLATRCGAIVLGGRAREELVSAGARPRRQTVVGVSALTPSEHRVVALAAHGLTNSEIAQRLFISPRTVAVHLSHSYQKLQIGSREELLHALDDAESA
jgi:DNA-binding CsgD family transcriptional regulator